VGRYNGCLRPFVPLFRNAHLMTAAGNFWPRKLDERRFPVERRLYRTEPGVQVLVLEQRPSSDLRGQFILVHGLEGSGESGYMRSMAQAALENGFAVHRFHMRSCGGTEKLCGTLYHAGLTSDLAAVVRQVDPPVFLVGYSLGGNVVLKLAGEMGEEARGRIAGVCGISTPLDLAACARRIGAPENRVYERRFVRRMRERLKATGRASEAELREVSTVYGIDDRYTAPSFGFRNADHYYATQSSGGYLDRIRVPALLLQAKDDTFIPFEIFEAAGLERNPCIELVATEYGGHTGFIARGRPRFWADQAVMEWVGGRSQKREEVF
jgi:uncharacterized protein